MSFRLSTGRGAGEGCASGSHTHTHTHTHPGSHNPTPLDTTVNKWAVRILLECFLIIWSLGWLCQMIHWTETCYHHRWSDFSNQLWFYLVLENISIWVIFNWFVKCLFITKLWVNAFLLILIWLKFYQIICQIFTKFLSNV